MFVKILAYLNTSWVGVVITIILSIIAFLLSYFFFLKSKPKHSINHYVKSTLLIDKDDTEKPDDVEIYFSKKPVNKLYKVLIYIWNSGNQTIRKSDLETIDKFRIDIENSGEILSIKTIKKTREVINFSLNNQTNSQIHEIYFDYLDPNDGVVIEIFHNGNRFDLKIKGTIIGISEVIEDKVKDQEMSFKNKKMNPQDEIIYKLISQPRLLISATIGTGILFICGSFFLHFNPNFNLLPEVSDKIPMGLLGLMYILFGLFLLFTSKRKFPKSLEITEGSKE